MRFLKESFDIDIYKFNKKDLQLSSNYVSLIGKSKQSNTIRGEIRYIKDNIAASQIVDFDRFIYIPIDQLHKYDPVDLAFEWPKPIDEDTIPTWKWARWKEKYPYKGV